jgi:hypothetical protein
MHSINTLQRLNGPDIDDDAVIQYALATQSDFIYQHEGTIGLLFPITDAARAWVDEHISDDAQWFGHALVIAWRYVDPIIEGIVSDGLEVAA